jgi:L-alanine-DL-glutamate epimerase-like enolase superfamily enzyme
MEKIINLEALEFPMGSSWIIDTEVANPMSIFPEYRQKRSSWMDKMTTVLVRVTTESGIEGLGWVGGGKVAAASIIRDVFARLLIGKNLFDRELLWEQMFRASVPPYHRAFSAEGFVEISSAPGFGYTLNEDLVAGKPPMPIW